MFICAILSTGPEYGNCNGPSKTHEILNDRREGAKEVGGEKDGSVYEKLEGGG